MLSSSGVGNKAATPFAGQYAGFENLSLSGPGGTYPIGILPISIAIDGNGGVVVTDSDGVSYIGQLGAVANGLPPNQFIATAFVSISTPPNISCLPDTFGYVGSVVGDNITGNASGTFTCTGSGITARLTVGGPFNAVRTGTNVSTNTGTSTGHSPAVGGARKSHKQKLILDGMQSVL